ncbi:MAG: flavodoxin family protein [Deltaproteobacteria bacterium]|nr:flavodoxin family protein [Deltaproteobacteria bacterium]
MKKVLGIIGSPRKLGNCEILVKEVCRNIEEDHTLKMIRLHDLDIKPCRACYRCIFDNPCPIDDDFKVIIESLVEADAVIIAAPTYILGPNASVKLFVDRGLQFYSFLNQMYEKPGITITVAGMAGKEGYTKMALSIIAHFMGLDVKENAQFVGSSPGEVLLNNKNKEMAAHLGRILFDGGYEVKQRDHVCPVCFNDTFQFFPDDRIRCTVCNNVGTISSNEETLKVQIKPGAGSWYMSYDEALKHKENLQLIKNEFLQKKEILKRITSDYKEDGEWINSNYNAG